MISFGLASVRGSVNFEDDGGTPAWRERRRPLPIIVMRTHKKRTLKNITFVEVISLILFFSFVLPWLLVLGVPAIGALVTKLLG